MSYSISEQFDGGIYDDERGVVIGTGIAAIPQSLFDEAQRHGWEYFGSEPGGMIRVKRGNPSTTLSQSVGGGEQTSPEIATIASKVLRGKRYTKEEVKSLAASALTQRG